MLAEISLKIFISICFESVKISKWKITRTYFKMPVIVSKSLIKISRVISESVLNKISDRQTMILKTVIYDQALYKFGIYFELIDITFNLVSWCRYKLKNFWIVNESKITVKIKKSANNRLECSFMITKMGNIKFNKKTRSNNKFL